MSSCDSDYYDETCDYPAQPEERGYANNSTARSFQQKLCASIDMGILSHSAFNNVVSSEAKAEAPRNIGLTKDTRATVEQVLDPRTMTVLSKMMKRGVFKDFHGCISTGKEANVYHAITSKGEDLAVKVYKTSILVFKDRSAYVEGEYRFRNGYCKSNPRKMVALWAEKELRNLKRLEEAGIPCPKIVEGRQNVVVMSFISSKDSKAAPRLKNVDEDCDWSDLYLQTVTIMRRMFHQCHLVHGDLSEYNLLLKEQCVFVIDVGQSVEQDHPHALDFLKRDCVNVNDFFSRRQVATFSLQDLFAWILSSDLKPLPEPSSGCDQDDQVFLGTFIPSTLNQVGDLAQLEEEIDKRSRGEQSLCDRLLANTPPTVAEEDSSDSSSDESDMSDSGSSRFEKKHRVGAIPEGMSKAEWKKKIKEENQEKRKNKIPKKDKRKERKKHSFRKQ